jgi:hypothetical protein
MDITPQQVRRALARADRGSSVDVDEATALLRHAATTWPDYARSRPGCATPDWSTPADRAW